MNYCRLRAFKTTTDKQKHRVWSRSCKFSLSIRLTCGAALAPGTLGRAGSRSGPKAAPGEECRGPCKAGMPPGSRECPQDRGNARGPAATTKPGGTRSLPPPRPAQTTFPVRPCGRARAAVRVRGAGSQSRRGRGERRPPPMLFSLSRGAGVVGGGAILEGTSARSRAAPGRGPGRRHAVPGGLSGE